MADTTLILSQRNSEWCAHGPILEQDIAITNISLDLLGQSRYLYQYAFGVKNNPYESKYNYISSIYTPYLTTYFSKVNMKLFSKVIYLDENVSIIQSEPAKGKICVNDWTTFFWCNFEGLKEQTSDSAEITFDGENINIK